LVWWQRDFPICSIENPWPNWQNDQLPKGDLIVAK
jgi:hypothetical protein